MKRCFAILNFQVPWDTALQVYLVQSKLFDLDREICYLHNIQPSFIYIIIFFFQLLPFVTGRICKKQDAASLVYTAPQDSHLQIMTSSMKLALWRCLNSYWNWKGSSVEMVHQKWNWNLWSCRHVRICLPITCVRRGLNMMTRNF